MKDIWIPVSGAIAQQRNVETIANNVANANTPGFKKDQAIFKEHLTAFEKGTDIDLPNKEWSPQDFYRTYGAEKGFVKTVKNYTNFEQGQLTPTNNPMDIALSGQGFFEVLSPNGIRYTRRGSLSVDAAGRLVTQQGYPILAKIDLPTTNDANELKAILQQVPEPKDRVITLDNSPLTVNHNGEVYQKGSKIADLSVVKFKETELLKKEGNSLFINKSVENVKREGTKTAVYQGFVERSNVNAVEEMSNLIKAHRQFESLQRVIKTYDSIAGKASNEIAKF
ncbi:MAG: flagellar hook-basal body protein [Oligoflexia bacterium]|nr:flagellar hook-basal body protein [Oligoflexia bacterium]